MKKIFIILLISFSFISAKDSSLKKNSLKENPFWTNSTADIVKKGNFEIGIFNSLKYGLTDDIQLEAHPINFFIMPNIKLKKVWVKNSNVIFSAQHSLNYPTFLLNSVSKKGIGGLLPPSVEFPNFLLFDNSVFATFGDKFKFTTLLGFNLNLGSIDKTIPTIDYPLIYPRLNAYYNRYSIYYGVSTNFDIKFIMMEVGIKMFALPMENGVDFSHLEQKTTASYQIKNWLLVDLGYLFSTGDYPFGRYSKFFPVVDFRFRF